MIVSLGIHDMRPQHVLVLVCAWWWGTPCSHRSAVVHICLEIPACADTSQLLQGFSSVLSTELGWTQLPKLGQEPPPRNVRNALSIYSAGSYWLKSHVSNCISFFNKAIWVSSEQRLASQLWGWMINCFNYIKYSK